MAERHVLVTVKIATEGRRCASYCDAEPCPFLRSSWDRCALLGEELVSALDVDSDERVWIRVPACLALDGGGVGEPHGVGGAESSAALDPLLVGVDP